MQQLLSFYKILVSVNNHLSVITVSRSQSFSKTGLTEKLPKSLIYRSPFLREAPPTP